MKEFKIAWVKHYGWAEIIVHDQGPEFMGSEFQNPAGAAGVLTMPIDSQSPWQNGKTDRAGQSFKHHLWDLDEECHIEGETEFEAAVAECCDASNRFCNRSGFSTHQRVFGSSLRLPGSLLSDDPIDRQFLTADPYTDFHRANEIRTAAQRALFKQNSARAVQAAGLARHRSQPREDINAGDTTMVWRNNNLTGRKGWTGIGVVVAVSPTRTSFWISMRGCLLKCSSEQVRKATDAEWLGAELSKTLATDMLKSRQRSGQRGYVDVETEGQPTEEPPADTRPDVNQILGAVVPAPSALAPIPELTRKAGSPQLVETYAASSAVVEMTWIKALWESMTWKGFDILTQRRSSRPLKTMMPHVIRNENPACYDPESTPPWIPKVCLMHWTMIYHRMTENPLWKFQSLKSLCAEQCVDLDGVRTIEMQPTP